MLFAVNFPSLSSFYLFSMMKRTDVIGIVKEASALGEITSSKLNRQVLSTNVCMADASLTTCFQLVKRELTLVDKTGFSVRMTLWGKQAEQYSDAEANPVIAFKGVKVGDFGGEVSTFLTLFLARRSFWNLGRSLSMYSSSTMQVNPEIDESFSLRGWYDSNGAEQTFKAHSSSGGGGSMAVFNRADIRSLDEVKQAGYGMPDKPETFSARATIMHIKSDNISYPACPTPNCNKKVVDNGGNWRCEKCSQSFSAPEHRFVLHFFMSIHLLYSQLGISCPWRLLTILVKHGSKASTTLVSPFSE